MAGRPGEVTVAVGAGWVATVEIHRPPNNYFDTTLIAALADVYQELDEDPGCRAIVLCSEGKHFCAGADFSGASADTPGAGPQGAGLLYHHAARLIGAKTPVVAAVQGAAIGGGLGLACAADFRVAGPRARFAANFARLGFHHGFGLTVTLPPLVGQQHALELLYTGRPVGAEEARSMGLADLLSEEADPRPDAEALARDIASSAPLAVRSIRTTMRGDLAARFRAATEHELAEQDRLRATQDFAEGVAAVAERRPARFAGR